MPMYNYSCKKCGKSQDLIHSLKLDEEQILEAFQVEANCTDGCEIKKNFDPIAIKFVGSGFYVNDYGEGRVR